MAAGAVSSAVLPTGLVAQPAGASAAAAPPVVHAAPPAALEGGYVASSLCLFIPGLLKAHLVTTRCDAMSPCAFAFLFVALVFVS